MAGTPDDDGGEGIPAGPETRALRALRILVTVLTAVMIGGIVAIVALLVFRLPGPYVPIPDALDLPEGARAAAFTRGPDWFAVVTGDDRILIFGADGALRQEIDVYTGG